MAQTQLIEDILDVSRIVNGKLRLKMSRRRHPRDHRRPRSIPLRPAVEAKRITITTESGRARDAAAIATGCSRSSGTCCRTRSSSRHVTAGSPCGWRSQPPTCVIVVVRQRPRDRARLPAARLRPVLAGRQHRDPHARRPRHRHGDRASPRRASWRHGPRGKRRREPWRHVHGDIADPRLRGAGRAAAADAAPRRGTRSALGRAAAPGGPHRARRRQRARRAPDCRGHPAAKRGGGHGSRLGPGGPGACRPRPIRCGRQRHRDAGDRRLRNDAAAAAGVLPFHSGHRADGMRHA